DATGTLDRNLTRTHQRAQAVAARLISNGVQPRRLRAVGYSNFCPLDPGTSDEANQKNRRVAFRIIRRAGKTLSSGGGCPKASDHGVAEPLVGDAIARGAEPPARACANFTKLETPGRKVRAADHLDVRDWQADDCVRASIRRYIAHHERVACGLSPNGAETAAEMVGIAQAARNLAATYPAADPERKFLLQYAIDVVEQAHAIATTYFEGKNVADLRQWVTASLALTYAAAGLNSEALALLEGQTYPRHGDERRAVVLPHALYLAGSATGSTDVLERALAMLRDHNQYTLGLLDREQLPYYLVEAAIWRALDKGLEAKAIERWVASKASCVPLWPGDLRGFPDWIRGGKVTAEHPETYP
ncbi:MAG: OmpA family protein, partial [Myxococcales bacterium]|nr:OmpA family protein [Myxococcales bacterium]